MHDCLPFYGRISDYGARHQLTASYVYNTPILHGLMGEGAQLQIGAQAFNVLNHPNFDQPVNDVSNPAFGSIIRTVGAPTSIFGSFLGGDASPRALQIRAQLQF